MSIQSTILSGQYQFMLDGTFSDFTIFVGNDQFTVHKFVLANRSPVFRAMFETPMVESRRGEMIVDDFEFGIFKLFLEYVYTGAIADRAAINTSAPVLILCASKYQVADLEGACAQSMLGQMTIENVVECLVIGDMLKNHVLLDTAFALAEDNWEGVKQSPMWPEVAEHHELATRIEMSKMRAIFKSPPIGNITIEEYPRCEVTFAASVGQLPRTKGAFGYSPSFTCPSTSGFGPEVEWKLKFLKETDNDGASIFLVYIGNGTMPSHVSGCFTAELKRYNTSVKKQIAFDSCLVHNRVQKLLEVKSALYNRPYGTFFFGIILKKSESKTVSIPMVDIAIRELILSPKDATSVVEVIVEDTTFSVLKCVISSAFSVLDRNMSDEKIVTIDCVTAATFQKMLDFMCSNDGECPESEMEDLLRAAYRIGLREKLFDHLRAIVHRNLNTENVMALLQLAVQEEDNKLKVECLDFVYFNLETLTSLPSWNLISGFPSVHLELLEMIFKRSSEPLRYL